MRDENTPRSGALVCTSCGAPARKVVAMDAVADPSCLRCRALELGGIDGEHGAAISLLDLIVQHIVMHGMAHPVDVTHTVADAVIAAHRRRGQLGMREVETFDEIQSSLEALRNYDELDDEGVE
jgi:hypothetical protein